MDGYEPTDDDGRSYLYPDKMQELEPEEPDEEVYDCPIHGTAHGGIGECPLC